MRQVTHALLTRPPLSHNTSQSEEIKVKCFARLACVKHAASVHPEPGSNSRIKSLGLVFSNLSVYALRMFLMRFFRTQNCRSFIFAQVSKKPSFVIQTGIATSYSILFTVPFSRTAGASSQMLFLKTILLKKFSRICCLLFSYQGSLFCCRSSDSLFMLPHRSPFVNNFFHFLFLVFFVAVLRLLPPGPSFATA